MQWVRIVFWASVAALFVASLVAAQSNQPQPAPVAGVPQQPQQPQEGERGFLGVRFGLADDGRRLRVAKVFAHSPAQACGLVEGDEIVSVNGVTFSFKDQSELGRAFDWVRAGDLLKLQVLRPGGEQAIELEAGVAPPEIVAEWARRRRRSLLVRGLVTVQDPPGGPLVEHPTSWGGVEMVFRRVNGSIERVHARGGERQAWDKMSGLFQENGILVQAFERVEEGTHVVVRTQLLPGATRLEVEVHRWQGEAEP